MESYRYQVKCQADYEKLAAELMENEISFTSQFSLDHTTGRKMFFITADLTPYTSDMRQALGNFLDNEIEHLMKADYMADIYDTADDAFNDPYADAGSLRTMLGSTLDHLTEEKKLHDTNLDDVRKQLDEVKKNRDFYQDNYYKEITKGGRVKEQVRAIALLMDSIFPKD